MRRLATLILAVWGIAILGCSNAKEEIRAKSVSEKTDVFHEVQVEDKLSEGFIDVVLKAQLKTHLEGEYLLESKKSLHGKPTYPFLLNIDGQTVAWEVKGQKEKNKEYEGCVKNHDCGEGMRYTLEKRIRLKEGMHRVFFALPGDNYRTEFEITLKENKHYNLEFKPIYWKQNYLKGISRFDVFINNAQVPQKSGG